MSDQNKKKDVSSQKVIRSDLRFDEKIFDFIEEMMFHRRLNHLGPSFLILPTKRWVSEVGRQISTKVSSFCCILATFIWTFWLWWPAKYIIKQKGSIQIWVMPSFIRHDSFRWASMSLVVFGCYLLKVFFHFKKFSWNIKSII